MKITTHLQTADNTLLQASQLIHHIIDLSHGCTPVTTALAGAFNRLKQFVDGLTSCEEKTLRQHPGIAAKLVRLHMARGIYEYHDEIERALSLLNSSDRCTRIQSYTTTHFPSTAIHSRLFGQFIEKKSKCLVVGCGAVPSTTMLLGENTSLQLTAIDRCPQSMSLADKLLAIWNQSPVTLKTADLFSLSCFDEWDVIFVNALVGANTANYLLDKQSVIKHLLTHCVPGTLLVLRTPCRTGKWIYPQINQSWFASYPSTVITPPTPKRSALMVVEC